MELTTQAVHSKPLKLLNGYLPLGQVAIHAERRLGTEHRLAGLNLLQRLARADRAGRQEGCHGCGVLLSLLLPPRAHSSGEAPQAGVACCRSDARIR